MMTMNYIYHRVPADMEGTMLYPLNTLKIKFSHLYQSKADKYIGREQIMERTIPTLNCLWNDVLHLTAVHPKDVKQAIVDADPSFFAKPMSFYQIDPHILVPENATVYLYRNEKLEKNFVPENFVSFDPEWVSLYSEFPEATKLYYKEMHAEGKKPLLFHRVPHILYKGSIETKGISVVTV
jgi:hypothetical protein